MPRCFGGCCCQVCKEDRQVCKSCVDRRFLENMHTSFAPLYLYTVQSLAHSSQMLPISKTSLFKLLIAYLLCIILCYCTIMNWI